MDNDFLSKLKQMYPRREWDFVPTQMPYTTIIKCANSSVEVERIADGQNRPKNTIVRVLGQKVHTVVRVPGRSAQSGSFASKLEDAFTLEGRLRDEWSKRKTELKRHIKALHETELLISSEVEITLPELVLKQGWIPKVELRFKGMEEPFASINYPRYELNCDRWEVPYVVHFGGKAWYCKDWRAVIEIFDSAEIFRHSDNHTRASEIATLEAYHIPDKEGREPRGMVIFKRERLQELAPYLLAMGVSNFHVETIITRVVPDWESVRPPAIAERETRDGDKFISMFQMRLDDLLADTNEERFVYADANVELAWDRSYTRVQDNLDDGDDEYLDDLDDEDDFEV